LAAKLRQNGRRRKDGKKRNRIIKRLHAIGTVIKPTMLEPLEN
jgi:hypothetical protein